MDSKSLSKYLVIGFFALLALVLIANSFYTINTGERGVVLRFGSLHDVADEGLNVKLPFIDRVEIMSVRDKKLSVKIEVSSSDIQTIALEVGLVYALDPAQVGRIYQRYGTIIEETLLRPALSEKINAVIAEYPIETFVEKRAEISNRINLAFSEQVAGSGTIIKNLLIVNHDFSDEFNKAIEDKKLQNKVH